MKCAVFIIVLVAVSATALPSKSLDKLLGDSVSDAACIAEHCSEFAIRCVTDPECVEAIGCVLGCLEKWAEDPTPQKYRAQNCTNKCSFTYGEAEAFPEFLGCVTDNKCIEFPPIPSTCKAASAKILKRLSTKDLEGRWWVVRGYNKAYDCYPCEIDTFVANGTTEVVYRAQFDAYLTNDRVKRAMIEQDLPITQPGEPIKLSYRDFGILMNEERWLLDRAEDNSWIIMYYCGNAAEWNYEGAQVLSREMTLSPTALMQVAASLKEAIGLNIEEFCKVRTTGCQV